MTLFHGGENQKMPNEKVVNRRFQKFTWRPHAKTSHVHKAELTKPENVDALGDVLREIVDAGPFLHGCRHLIGPSTCIKANRQKEWIGVIPVRKLIALAQWDFRRFHVLAVIDLDRLSRRPNRKYCYVLDPLLDLEARRLGGLSLFVDPQNCIACMRGGEVLFFYEVTESSEVGVK
jgi:hypothetical protein